MRRESLYIPRNSSLTELGWTELASFIAKAGAAQVEEVDAETFSSLAYGRTGMCQVPVTQKMQQVRNNSRDLDLGTVIGTFLGMTGRGKESPHSLHRAQPFLASRHQRPALLSQQTFDHFP